MLFKAGLMSFRWVSQKNQFRNSKQYKIRTKTLLSGLIIYSLFKLFVVMLNYYLLTVNNVYRKCHF